MRSSLHNTNDHAADIKRLEALRHHDRRPVLGRHRPGDSWAARSLLPAADRGVIADTGARMQRLGDSGIFESSDDEPLPERYRVTWRDRDRIELTHYELFCFPAQISDVDRHLFNESRHLHSRRFPGAHCLTVDGVDGVRFALWAPAQ